MQIIDFDPYFTKNKEKGIDYIYDDVVIKQSLKILLMIDVNSLIHYRLPHFGCNLKKLIGKKINPVFKDQIKTNIETSIENYMPKVKLKSVDVKLIKDVLLINLNYYIKNFTSEDNLEIKFQLLT